MENLKLLIPVDFSDQSQFAIDYAHNFTKTFEVEVLLLHVLEISAFTDVNTEGHFDDFMGINTEMLEIQQKAAVDKMQALKEKEAARFPALSTHLKLGPLTETIINFSHHRKVDLILMGTKGGESLKAWFSGSETQIVARRSEVPVLTVMCDRPDALIENLLFISDFNDMELAPDPVVTTLAKGFGARLHLLCIASPKFTDDEVKRKCIEDYAREHHLENYEIHIHREKKVVDGIQHFDLMEKMDLVALGTHGRKGINHLIKGSIAEKLINHLHKPVLVYKI